MADRRKITLVVMFASFFATYIVFPGGMLWLSVWLENAWSLPRLFYGWPNFLLGAMLIVPALLVSSWTIYTMWRIGNGTVVPMLATQRLIVTGPFRHCRNPAFGSMMVVYLSVAVMAGSPAMAAVLVVFGLINLAGIKLWEEPDLVRKFGAEYIDYMRTTPFLIPRLWR
jgi:protein-S-isoprenylcysteine O-methyltransferase Ste14